MAKFVIAGSSDCPYMAKLELLACELSLNLPMFDVHKILLPPEKWPTWLSETCEKNGWKHKNSPIVWRELVDRGGKGLLVGGFNEFCEYAECYYGVTSSMMTELMVQIRDENVITCAKDIEEEEEFRNSSKPIHVCIVNAISPVAYHFIPRLACGDVFGPDVEVSIRLLDSKSNQSQLQGVAMETEDLAFPLMRRIDVCSDAREAMRDASAVIFLEDDDSPEPDESRDEFLRTTAGRYQEYSRIIDDVAMQNAKVLVAGNGAVNFCAYIILDGAKKLKKENVAASPRLQDRRARAILSRRLKVNSNDVKDVLIIGNCSNNPPEQSSVVAVSCARVNNYDGAIWGPSWFSRNLIEMVYDRDWLKLDFVTSHRDHDTNLTKTLKHSAAMSEASALAFLLRDWIQGTSGEEISSLGILCEDRYDINDCVFSLPVRFVDGSYSVVDTDLDEDTRNEMKRIELYLKKDLRVAFPFRFEEIKPAFGEESILITPSSSLSDPAPKTVSGLTVIQEDVAAESQSAEEQLPNLDLTSNALDPTSDVPDPASDAPDPGSDAANPASEAPDPSDHPVDMEAQPSSEESPIELDNEEVPADS